MDWSPGAVVAYLTILGILLGALWRCVVLYHRFASRWEVIERRSRITWEFICRRGWVKAQTSGVLDMTALSPESQVSDEVREAFAAGGLSAELRAWYRRRMRQDKWVYDEDILRMDIEETFGARIARAVCLPLKMDSGECLVIALILAREEHSRPTNG